MTSERIAAIIPAYEAADTVAGVIKRTLAVVEDVVVVDDGSTDGTGDVAESAGARVLRHAENRGKGFALRTAFSDLERAGDVDAALTLDADGQHLPEEAPKLFAARDADLVIGTRSDLFDEMGRRRRRANRISTRMISWAAGTEVLDAQSGFRLYRRRLFHPEFFRPGRFESETSAIVRAARAGLVIANVAVDLAVVDGRSTSHYRQFTDSARIARAVVGAILKPARV